jgi:YHS domain-containing protein
MVTDQVALRFVCGACHRDVQPVAPVHGMKRAWVDWNRRMRTPCVRLHEEMTGDRSSRKANPILTVQRSMNWAAATADGDGRVYYFRVDERRRKFAEAPDRYCSAPP